MEDKELAEFLKKNAISLKLNEARKIVELIGRNPTITELHIFNIQWSEHSSYKSSKNALKMLPTTGPTVILGPKEDAGILKLDEEYGIVISHESHNHPSQVVPYEGAATGIGGNVRDVLCMGAKVIAGADPLRFGEAFSENKSVSNRTKYIANQVINGIATYGNAIGVPVIAGDIYMNSSFNDNCLVNVVHIGLIKNNEIIHSCAPENSIGYDVIVIGKPTDNSGFGGAAFASLILDEKNKENNRGAVQVPDPFLKNVLIRASYRVFEAARKQKVTLGFKDCGAGGIMCATSELGASGNMGIELNLNEVPVSMQNLPSYIIACSETQERFCWISPKEFTKTILDIYNKEFELPNVAEDACAKVIGRVIKDKKYILKYNNKIVCNADIRAITEGIRYNRESEEIINKKASGPELIEPESFNTPLLDVLKLPQIASKYTVYEHYDNTVQGNTVIRCGEADAGLIAPLPGKKYGVALKVDCNPRYNRVSSYHGAVNAIAEVMRNIAAIGATPIGLTDCLNYGNPEKPEQFWQFLEGIRGLSDAAKNIFLKGTTQPVPFVSGNVSFYNGSANGKSIDPSPIVACVGRMEDYSKAITLKIKKSGSGVYLVGARKNELGGSAYYELFDELGANLPKTDFASERNMIYGVIDAINERLLLASHDISDGGLIVAVTEMILGGKGAGKIGASLQLNDGLKTSALLFSESSGFVMEIEDKNLAAAEKAFAKYDVDLIKIGETGGDYLIVNHNDKEVVNLDIPALRDAWMNGFGDAMK
ncbi:phosphoribosylformylglycinamidine synthase subunit PurL [Candidatus Woesearchaeota archaeon]|nr:phosphoribosylformylglycinamidine synthase subunit PurL [Candidatus Woesearchaeota archaeon]